MSRSAKIVCILLSDKRSGSTLFQREICKHPMVQTVAYSPHTYLETHHWLKAAVVLGAAAKNFSGAKVYPGYGSRQNAKTYLIDEIKGNVPDFELPDTDKALVFKGWDALCEKFAQPVFFEKSPQYIANWASLSLLLEWAKQTSYEVKFIGLTRNPLSVQYSAAQLFHTAPEQRQFGWLENQRNLLAFESLVGKERFLSVKYEDIIADSQQAFNRIFDFINIPKLKEVGASVHSKSLDKWRDDPSFTLRLDPSVAQVAQYFGYSAEELYNPPKPEPSAWQKNTQAWLFRFYRLKNQLKDRVIKPLLLSVKNRKQ
jgi:hypothetical protein